jgi:putative DNA primase/helicase
MLREPFIVQDENDLNGIWPEHSKPNGGARAKPQPQSKPGAELLIPGLHDAGNGERIVLLYGDRLRYCYPMRKWLCWDGRRWRPDESGEVIRLAKDAMVQALQAAIDTGNENAEKFFLRSLDSRRLDGALKLAQCELPVMPDQLDADRDLLTVANGTLHLPTGTLRPHSPADLITKLAPVSFEPAAECPTFEAFIHHAMGRTPRASAAEEDRARRRVQFLQVALGYSCTGCTREKAVFIPYGPSNGGKTTLLWTIQKILGDYSAQIQSDSLMAARDRADANVLSDLADLRGARFAVTSETEEGQYFSQARLKRLTQGMGRIKTTRKYENPIEFPETHKLWLDTNRRPRLRDADDDATLNRLHPIPFEASVPREEQDRELPAKLMAEATGILAWLAAGALAWYQRGLELLPEVAEAREAWRTEDDQMERFLEDCCVRDADLEQPAGELYRTYKKWCEETGEHTTLSAARFKQRLSAKGVSHRETKSGNLYVGVRLKGGLDALKGGGWNTVEAKSENFSQRAYIGDFSEFASTSFHLPPAKKSSRATAEGEWCPVRSVAEALGALVPPAAGRAARGSFLAAGGRGCEGLRGLARDSVEKSFNSGG